MTTQATLRPRESGSTESFGAQLPFEGINEPGCYICNWTGHLLRIPEDGLKAGRTPGIEMSAREPLFVTRLSDNPYLPVSKARLLAADCDVPVNF